MSASDFTPIETAALAEIYAANAKSGFPNPTLISFESRELTPCGRYVATKSAAFESLEDGYYDMGGRYLEIQGVANGAMAVARVQDRRVVELEMSTYDGQFWTGDEDEFSIV